MDRLANKLTTYVGSFERLKLALNYGAEHLIFEDPKLSARSYAEATLQIGFQHLEDWAQYARIQNPDIEISFNLDIMIHDRHFPLILLLIKTLEKANIQHIRVQDTGLTLFFKTHFSKAHLTLAMETGNQNLESIYRYTTLFDSQVLNNEMPFSELKKTVLNCPHYPFELQVQGPLLIQYSNRRYMAGFEETEAPLYRIAQDEQYPNRFFPFYDNVHGHFMYLYFDRCLLTYIPDLLSLDLSGWIIDARGESDSYLIQTLTLYKKYRTLTVAISDPDLESLASLAQRPQKGGFFRANRTDQDRESVVKEVEGYHYTGIVIDTVSKKQFTFETLWPLSLGNEIKILTPEGHEANFTLAQMSSAFNIPLIQAQVGDIISLPWQKRVVTQSKVFLKK